MIVINNRYYKHLKCVTINKISKIMEDENLKDTIFLLFLIVRYTYNQKQQNLFKFYTHRNVA